MSGGGKVLVVDDEEKILDIVKSYLEVSGFQVFCARTGNEALSVWRREAARGALDLVLLDLMLPDISGETVCRKIREVSDVPVIMLTAKADEESIVAGLNRGADDYVVKPFSPKQLMARVEAVLRRTTCRGGEAGMAWSERASAPPPGERKPSLLPKGGLTPVPITPSPREAPSGERRLSLLPKGGLTPVPIRSSPREAPSGLSSGGLTLDMGNRSVRKNGRLIPLTANQFNLLALLMAHPAKIWTRDEIIEEIKGDDFDGFDRAVDTHIKNLRQKLGDDPKSPRYIVTVYGMGYRWGGMDNG